MMRNVILSTGLVASLTAGVLADGQVLMTSPGAPYRGGNGGGAFRAEWVSGYIGRLDGYGSTGDNFLTFCLELTEHVALPHQYFAQLNDGAIAGGAGGGNPDPISNATALLYRTYRANQGFGARSAVDTTAEATSFQLAVWFLEDEMSVTDPNDPNYALSQQYLALYNADQRAQDYVSWGNQNAGALGGVRAMSLWESYDPFTGRYSGRRQDMLTIVPVPPAAWAGMASLAGIGAFGYMRRRSFRA